VKVVYNQKPITVDPTDRQARIDLIVEHYENPHHYGALPNPTVVQKGSNPGCGDIITMYLKVDDQDRITEISFEGEGCTISQAAASMATREFEGRHIQDVESTPTDWIVDLLGREIAGTRLNCAVLALHTTKAAVRSLIQSRMAR
jgi:nitrogen fixation protein NifU and related proteins